MLKGHGAVGKIIKKSHLFHNEEYLRDAANPPSMTEAIIHFEKIKLLSESFKYLIYFSSTKDGVDDDYCKIKAYQSEVYNSLSNIRVVEVELAHLDAPASYWEGISNCNIVVSDKKPEFINYNLASDLLEGLNLIQEQHKNNNFDKKISIKKHDLIHKDVLFVIIPNVWIMRVLLALKKRKILPFARKTLIDSAINLEC